MRVVVPVGVSRFVLGRRISLFVPVLLAFAVLFGGDERTTVGCEPELPLCR